MDKMFYSPQDLVALGLYKDRDSVYRRIKKGDIPAVRIKGSNNWVVRKEDISKIFEVNKCDFTKEEKYTGLTSVTKIKDTGSQQKQKLKLLQKSLQKQ